MVQVALAIYRQSFRSVRISIMSFHLNKNLKRRIQFQVGTPECLPTPFRNRSRYSNFHSPVLSLARLFVCSWSWTWISITLSDYISVLSRPRQKSMMGNDDKSTTCYQSELPTARKNVGVCEMFQMDSCSVRSPWELIGFLTTWSVARSTQSNIL